MFVTIERQFFAWLFDEAYLIPGEAPFFQYRQFSRLYRLSHSKSYR